MSGKLCRSRLKTRRGSLKKILEEWIGMSYRVVEEVRKSEVNCYSFCYNS